jgi:hypothetical protein
VKEVVGVAHVATVKDRAEICSKCGVVGRVLIETDMEIIDRCLQCGHERVYSVMALVGRAGQKVQGLVDSPMVSPAAVRDN